MACMQTYVSGQSGLATIVWHCPWVDPKVVMPKGIVASFLSLTMLYLELNDCYRQTNRHNFDISNHSASLHSCANEQIKDHTSVNMS